MGKHIIILLTFFFVSSLSLLGQINNGIAIYSVNADGFVSRVKRNNEKKGVKRESIFESMAEEMDRIELMLIFNDSISKFTRDPGLAVDHSERIFNLALAFANRGTYYTDITKKSLVLIREYLGEDILVQQDIPERHWKLTPEQKKIGDFICYKAESSIDTPSGTYPLIAWYAPDIPLSYGPSDYGGYLPGLILELHTNEVSYSCKRIDLNPSKPISIEWPDTQGSINEKEYKKINQDLTKSLKEHKN